MPIFQFAFCYAHSKCDNCNPNGTILSANGLPLCERINGHSKCQCKANVLGLNCDRYTFNSRYHN